MSTNRATEAAVPTMESLRRRPTILQRLGRFASIKPLGAVGALLLIALIVIAFLAPFVAPYDPLEMHDAYMYSPPCPEFILGTDEFGRDILSRIIWGSQISLYVGFFAVVSGTAAGAIFGLVSAYWGGKADLIIQRFMDTLMAFPYLVFAMVIVTVLGRSVNNVVIAIAIVLIPRACRVIRSSALSIKETQFIDAARAIGCSDQAIILRHMLPNCLAPYIILISVSLATAILTEASLSFLGLGVPPPEPSWGGMLSGAAQLYVRRSPWMAIFPGIAITLTVFGFNLFGDALRDVWDPRLRRG